jgi:hypothetical protein
MQARMRIVASTGLGDETATVDDDAAVLLDRSRRRREEALGETGKGIGGHSKARWYSLPV